MKEIIIRVRDDLDGSRADETIEYSWRGQAYEIDLSLPNVAEFEKDMERWLAVSRPAVEPARSRKRASADPSAPSARAVKAQRKAIREWARQNGMHIRERGHIQRVIVEGYQLAHPHERVFSQCYPPQRGQDRPTVATSVRAQEAINGEVAALQLFAPKQLSAAKTGDHHERSGNTARTRAIPDKARRDEIRQWGRDNGFDVSSNGYIRGEIVAAFETAHARNGQKVH